MCYANLVCVVLFMLLKIQDAIRCTRIQCHGYNIKIKTFFMSVSEVGFDKSKL